MSVTIQWDNPEKTIIYVRYERWTWDEYYESLNECTRMCDAIGYPVYIICDLVDNIVPKGGAISHAIASLKRSDGRVERIVLVTPNRFIRAMTQMSGRVLPEFNRRYRMTDTVEHARELIAAERASHIVA